MNKNYLTEAFQELKILDEEKFELTDKGIVQSNDFLNGDASTDFEEIIDPLAETEEELQDSYIGKIILDCSICQSKIYKTPEEVIINEAGDLANEGDECPYCHSVDGYKVIGQVAPYADTEDTEVTTDDNDVDISVKEKEENDTSAEDLDEAIKSKKGIKKLDSMKEDLQNVEIETDKETITVSSEPKEKSGAVSEEEVIAPVEPETESEFKKEEPEEEDEYTDIDIDEFDESDFDNLGESYLKRVYENVNSYKTTKGSVEGNKLKLEGIINFKSGKNVKTNFVFEAATATKNGKVKFTGLNEQFAKGKKTYTLTGKVDGKKLIAESLVYNYHTKDNDNKSKRIYGRIINK